MTENATPETAIDRNRKKPTPKPAPRQRRNYQAEHAELQRRVDAAAGLMAAGHRAKSPEARDELYQLAFETLTGQAL